MAKSLSGNRAGGKNSSDSLFKQQVLNIIAGIPKGKVMSYGQVAAMAGIPRAARQVGGILRHYDGNDSLPWWRVINNTGHITIKGNFIATPALQKQLLERDGIKVAKNYSLDMREYRFRAKN